MVAAFDVEDVLPNPARFDLKKAESIDGDHIRLLAVEDFAGRLVPYLEAAGVVSTPLSPAESATLAAVAPLVQTRMALLGEAPELLASFFVSASSLTYAPDALASLPENAGVVLVAAIGGLELVPEPSWNAESIQAALQSALIEGLGLKPRVAYGPLRVALSGRRISPPLFESMEILGKPETIARLDALVKAL
jgi:glutamyl-tRNA synthetase